MRQQAGVLLSFSKGSAFVRTATLSVFHRKTEVNLNPNQKQKRPAKALSKGDQKEIREYYLSHAISVRALALMAGVSAATVWRAITLA